MSKLYRPEAAGRAGLAEPQATGGTIGAMQEETTRSETSPSVGLVMGSSSDWPTMCKAAEILDRFGVRHEAKVVSAHRTPDDMAKYGQTARDRGLSIIIAGAGGAAHLPGMLAAFTTLPVLGVPVKSSALSGLDSLLSIVQMPGGVPVGTLSIGEAGATNAGLLAVSILSLQDAKLGRALQAYREERAQAARASNSELTSLSQDY